MRNEEFCGNGGQRAYNERKVGLKGWWGSDAMPGNGH